MADPMKLGIALSGGGVRAAVFHLGVLLRLADSNLLESISCLSTVSGGSLIAAVIMSKARMRWPGSSEYRSEIYPAVKHLLTTTDLFSFRALGWTGTLKFNIRVLRHRASILADLLKRKWEIDGALGDLPDQPVWWINTTCLETGKNWRFSKREMGDWQFGRHYNPPFSIAEAAAASAAVPYVIGALYLRLPTEGWYRTDPATRKPLEKTHSTVTHIHLWDGGAYENLGLEAMFKPGKPLIGCNFLICSDASGPLPPFGTSSPLNLVTGRLASPRLFDVASDQIRALRSRMFVSAIEIGAIRGALLRMGNSVRDIDIKASRSRDQSAYDRFQTEQDVASALLEPTELKAISAQAFDRIARHGYEVTDATLTAYAPEEFNSSATWTSTR
jgi:NTE family protein